jgi:hypothetical protein
MYSMNGKNVERWGLTETLSTPLIDSWGFSEWEIGNIDIPWNLDDVCNLLIEQFKKKPNIVSLVRIFCTPWLDLEYALQQFSQCRNLDTITGDRLDIAGVIVGILRNGLSDDEYRIMIKLWIFLNKSCGEPEILIAATKLFTKASEVHFKEIFPAKVLIEFVSAFTPPANLRELLQRLALGGVQIFLSWSNDSGDFGFDQENGFESGCFGFYEKDYSDPYGGKFVEKI